MNHDPDDMLPADADLDRRLRDLLDRELRPHVGSARAAFERQIAAETRGGGDEKAAVAGGSRSRAWWLGGGVATALAASVAVAGGLWLNGESERPTPPIATQSNPPVQASPSPGYMPVGWSPSNVVQQEVWRAQEAGIAMVDGRPHRAVEHERVQSASFVDAAGYSVEITVPERNYIFVDLGTAAKEQTDSQD